MFKPIALAAIFVTAAQAGLHARHEHMPNGTYSAPGIPHSSSVLSSGTQPNSATTASSASGTGSSSAILSSSASGGISPSSNGTLSSSIVPVLTTEIVYTTVTSCPVTKTHGSGEGASLEISTAVSTVVITSTKTICTKCVAPPETGAPASMTPVQGATAPYPTGPSSMPVGTGTAPAGTGAGSPSSTGPESPFETNESVTLSYTLGAGSSKTVVTKTVYNTHRVTNYETLSVIPTASSEGAGESGSPESGPEQGESSNSILSTIEIYVSPTSNAEGAAQTNQCPQQVTVTVPGPDVTVTVTGMSGPPSGIPGGPGGSPESSGPPAPPFPTGASNNGTGPGTGTGKPKCKSTGFITKPSASATFNLHPSSSDMFPVPSAHGKK